MTMGFDEYGYQNYMNILKKFVQRETGKEVVEIIDFYVGEYIEFIYIDDNGKLHAETYYYKKK